MQLQHVEVEKIAQTTAHNTLEPARPSRSVQVKQANIAKCVQSAQTPVDHTCLTIYDSYPPENLSVYYQLIWHDKAKWFVSVPH